MNNYYSNVYWHFVGSPEDMDWSEIYRPSDIIINGRQTKSDDTCMKILKSIIQTNKLLAKSTIRFDEFETEKFCCVTDIPIQNLKEHTKYYGNCAIGFEANTIYCSNFQPVSYIDSYYPIVNERIVDNYNQSNQYQSIPKSDVKKNNDISYKNSKSYYDKKFIKKYGQEALSFIKPTIFSTNQEDTFYREREWRKIGNFEFGPNKIASIILPENYFYEILEFLITKNIKDVPILTWELLENI